MKHILLVLALIISSLSIAQNQRGGVQDEEADKKWTNIPAQKSVTDNPDDGYPNIIAIIPGTRIPTYGELKRQIVKTMSHVIKDPNGVSDISNYSNIDYEAWDCTYTEASKSKPEYDIVYNFHSYVGKDYYSGRLSQRTARTGMKLVHRKTGEIIEL